MTDRRDDEFSELPEHLREHARRVREVQARSRATEPAPIETTREPFADGWDNLPGALIGAPVSVRVTLDKDGPSIEAKADVLALVEATESLCSRIRRHFGL